MKVCLITNLYPPEPTGGAGVVVHDTARALALDGHEVLVISAMQQKPTKEHGLVSESVEEGVHIFRLWQPNVCAYSALGKKNIVTRLIWHFFDFFNHRATKNILEILNIEKPDVVHTHNLMGIGFGFLRKLQKKGFYHIHTLHDIQLVEPSGILSHDHKSDSSVQRLYSRFMKLLFGKPKEIITPSKYLRIFYQNRKFFPHSEWKVVEKNEHSLFYEIKVSRQERVHFLYVGSLTKHKGVGVILEAWKNLPPRAEPILHIIGDGPLREEIEDTAFIDKRIVVHGYIPNAQMNEYYKKAHALLFPSVCIENKPNVIIEALANGLPVIAADTGGVRELIEDNINGILLPPNNPVELGQALKKFVLQDNTFTIAMRNEDGFLHEQVGVYKEKI